MATERNNNTDNARGEVSCTLEEIATRSIVHAGLTHPARVNLLREIQDMARNALLVSA